MMSLDCIIKLLNEFIESSTPYTNQNRKNLCEILWCISLNFKIYRSNEKFVNLLNYLGEYVNIYFSRIIGSIENDLFNSQSLLSFLAT